MSTEETNIREIIAPFSRCSKTGVSNQGYAIHGKNTEMSAMALYYNPEKPSAFSTLNKITEALPKKNKSDVRDWLEHQDDYTMHRPVRKRFLRNPNTYSNIMDVWECDILDMQSLAKYNDMY
jgi:hypothetical protein